MMGLCCSCSDDNPPIFATLSGTVTDYETGELLEDVMVTLTPLNITQRTDKTGSFCFDSSSSFPHPNRSFVGVKRSKFMLSILFIIYVILNTSHVSRDVQEHRCGSFPPG